MTKKKLQLTKCQQPATTKTRKHYRDTDIEKGIPNGMPFLFGAASLAAHQGERRIVGRRRDDLHTDQFAQMIQLYFTADL